MKKLILLSLVLMCGCALVTTDDHTEVFEKFDKRFPNQQKQINYQKYEPGDRRF